MGAADPILFLPEMALPTQLVTVIHVYFYTFFGNQNIPVVLVVTRKTGQLFILVAVDEGDVSMGDCNRIGHGYWLVVVALAALEALHLILAGFDMESPPLVPYLREDSVYRNRGNRFHRSVVKGRGGIFHGLDDTAIFRIGIPSSQDEYQPKNDGQAIFNLFRCFHSILDGCGFTIAETLPQMNPAHGTAGNFRGKDGLPEWLQPLPGPHGRRYSPPASEGHGESVVVPPAGGTGPGAGAGHSSS